MAIQREFPSAQDPTRPRTTLADAVLAQMLPPCAIKGGGALKFRYGDAATRFTRDLDAARAADLDDFVSELSDSLTAGWEGFTGGVVPKAPAHPEGVPDPYVMHPFDVKLSYNMKSWVTIPLEIGHDEIGDTEDVEYRMSSDIAEMFERLGFPAPKPVPVLALHHQVAQKLHAVSAPGSERAHDLVDLQLIASAGDLDLARAREACVRLFASRHGHAWPPTIAVGERWGELYDHAREGLPALADVGEAVAWANDLIIRIDLATQSPCP